MDKGLIFAIPIVITIALVCLSPAQTPASFSAADQSPRRALVVGNSAYRHLPTVGTASNDAAVVQSALNELKFKIVSLIDIQNAETQKRAIDDFTDSVQPSEVVLFYYTGRAVQVEDDDFLLPLDFDPANGEPIASRGYSIRRLLTHLSKAKARLIVIDASRPVPGSRYPDGLTDISPSDQTLMAFSTAPDTISLTPDKQGETSVYAECTASALKRPGLTVLLAFEEARFCVIKATNDKQRPVYKNDGLASLRFWTPRCPRSRP